MIIAINSFGPQRNDHYSGFIEEAALKLAQHCPELEVYLFVAYAFGKEISFPINLKQVIINNPFNHNILLRWWHLYKLKTKLKAIKADVLVNSWLWPSAKSPYCTLLSFADIEALIKKSFWQNLKNKRRDVDNLVKSKSIITLIQSSKDLLLKNFSIQPDKIKVVPPAKDPFLIPATSEVQTRIKEEFTDGKEYFIANISEKDPAEFIKLLKAFSIFKKRQQSNMKLVIIPLNNETHGIFQEHLENYKYNGDVILRNNLSLTEQARLLGSAYACIYLSPVYFEGMALEALQPGIPILLPINSPMSEITGDAALYFNASEITSLADQLMLIFKDEDLRNKLILKGKNLAAKYNWEQTVIVFRQSIAEAIQ